LKIWIPGGTPSSKNSKVWTGRFFIPSKAVRKWCQETQEDWEKNAQAFREEFDKKEKPVKVYFTFIRKSRHQFDYINPAQTVQDEMVKYGLIPDDNADEIIPVFKPYSYDKKNAGVWIEIK